MEDWYNQLKRDKEDQKEAVKWKRLEAYAFLFDSTRYKTYSIEGKLREEGWDEELGLMSEQDRLNLFTIAPVQRNLPDLNGEGA